MLVSYFLFWLLTTNNNTVEADVLVCITEVCVGVCSGPERKCVRKCFGLRPEACGGKITAPDALVLATINYSLNNFFLLISEPLILSLLYSYNNVSN